MVPRQVSPVCCDSEKREGEAGRGDEKNERGRCVVEKGSSVIRGETYREEPAHLLIEREAVCKVGEMMNRLCETSSSFTSPHFHFKMGWFSSSPSDSTPTSSDSNAPSRSERKACWDSRDEYFGCLDKNQVSVPGQEGAACKDEDGTYRKHCAASWVSLEFALRKGEGKSEIEEERECGCYLISVGGGL